MRCFAPFEARTLFLATVGVIWPMGFDPTSVEIINAVINIWAVQGEPQGSEMDISKSQKCLCRSGFRSVANRCGLRRPNRITGGLVPAISIREPMTRATIVLVT